MTDQEQYRGIFVGGEAKQKVIAHGLLRPYEEDGRWFVLDVGFYGINWTSFATRETAEIFAKATLDIKRRLEDAIWKRGIDESA